MALASALLYLLSSGGSARAQTPQLVQVDQVTTRASSVPSANAWGANADRLVRARNGDLYTTYVSTGKDSEHFRWVLAKRSAGRHRWRVVASGITAHEPGNPPSVLLGPSGTVFVVTISAWDSPGAGAPEIWSSASRRATVVRARWLTGRRMLRASSVYPAAGIDPNGDIFIWENVVCPDFRYASGRSTHCKNVDTPGTVRWAYKRAGSRRWHSAQWVSAYRYAYDFLLPWGTNGLRVIGTRDILEAPYEAPYPCPGRLHYCFDQAVQAQWTNLSRRPSSLIIGRTAARARGYSGDHRASAEDAYIDTLGRTHVLVSVDDASTKGKFESHELVIGSNGTVEDVPYYAVPYPNFSRILQDPSGRFWIYSVGPSLTRKGGCAVFIAGSAANDTDGTHFGPTTVLRLPTRFTCASETRNYDVSERTGTELAYYIDGVVATNGGSHWMHYRISLPAAPISMASSG
jgi:hypothetical protein